MLGNWHGIWNEPRNDYVAVQKKAQKNGEYIKGRKSLASGIAGGSRSAFSLWHPLLLILLLPSPCLVFSSLSPFSSSPLPHPVSVDWSLCIDLFYDFLFLFQSRVGGYSCWKSCHCSLSPPATPLAQCVCVYLCVCIHVNITFFAHVRICPTFKCAACVSEVEGYPKHKQGTCEAFAGPLTITMTVSLSVQYTFQRRVCMTAM